MNKVEKRRQAKKKKREAQKKARGRRPPRQVEVGFLSPREIREGKVYWMMAVTVTRAQAIAARAQIPWCRVGRPGPNTEIIYMCPKACMTLMGGSMFHTTGEFIRSLIPGRWGLEAHEIEVVDEGTLKIMRQLNVEEFTREFGYGDVEPYEPEEDVQ